VLDQGIFWKKGGTERKVYASAPSKKLTKSQKIKLRKKKKEAAKEYEKINISFSESAAKTGARKYIIDSGASFHLVDPGTLTDEERRTIEKIDEPIPLETANGEVIVNKRCLIHVKELDIKIWAFLHVDTVCVISLGLLVDRGGFTFNWQPGKAPTLTKGKIRVSSQPSFNVPTIYTAKFLAARKASLTLTKTKDPARGNPFAIPSTSSDDDLCFDQILEEEMKGAEDLIPPPTADAQEKTELKPRSRP